MNREYYSGIFTTVYFHTVILYGSLYDIIVVRDDNLLVSKFVGCVNKFVGLGGSGHEVC